MKPKGAVLRVEAALREAGIESEVVHTPESARTAEEAAATVGTSVSQIVKSLIFLCDGAPVIALVSGSNRLDTKALGELAGGRIERADAVKQTVERAARGEGADQSRAKANPDQRDSLSENQLQHISPARAERETNSHLARPLRRA